MLTTTSRDRLRACFQDTGTYAPTLVTALADLFGDIGFVNWEPEALDIELDETLGLRPQNMPPVIRDRIHGACAAMSTNSFYVSLESFIHLSNALAGGGVDFGVFDPATCEEAACAVMEVGLLDGENRPDAGTFSQEIRHYVGVRASYEGLPRLPEALRWAQPPKKKAREYEVDDADMFAAQYRNDQDRVMAIDRTVSERRKEIIRQVSALPLRARDEEQWKQYAGTFAPRQ